MKCMNVGKPLTKSCKICHSMDLSYFRYDNHLNHFNNFATHDFNVLDDLRYLPNLVHAFYK